MTIPLHQTIQDVVKRIPAVMPYLSQNALALLAQPKATKALSDYSSIRDRFWDAVYNAVSEFLNSNQQTGTAARTMTTALSQAYIEAADVAYVDGGGSLPLDDDTAAWARAELNAQFAYVDSLFQTLKALRSEEDLDVGEVATTKAESWTSSLNWYYNNIKLKAVDNIMLTFTKVRNTKDSCDPCVRLRGQRHRARWWVVHDFVPPRGGGLDCSGGGHCGDVLMTDDGKEFTI